MRVLPYAGPASHDKENSSPVPPTQGVGIDKTWIQAPDIHNARGKGNRVLTAIKSSNGSSPSTVGVSAELGVIRPKRHAHPGSGVTLGPSRAVTAVKITSQAVVHPPAASGSRHVQEDDTAGTSANKYDEGIPASRIISQVLKKDGHMNDLKPISTSKTIQVITSDGKVLTLPATIALRSHTLKWKFWLQEQQRDAANSSDENKASEGNQNPVILTDPSCTHEMMTKVARYMGAVVSAEAGNLTMSELMQEEKELTNAENKDLLNLLMVASHLDIPELTQIACEKINENAASGHDREAEEVVSRAASHELPASYVNWRKTWNRISDEDSIQISINPEHSFDEQYDVPSPQQDPAQEPQLALTEKVLTDADMIQMLSKPGAMSQASHAQPRSLKVEWDVVSLAVKPKVVHNDAPLEPAPRLPPRAHVQAAAAIPTANPLGSQAPPLPYRAKSISPPAAAAAPTPPLPFRRTPSPESSGGAAQQTRAPGADARQQQGAIMGAGFGEELLSEQELLQQQQQREEKEAALRSLLSSTNLTLERARQHLQSLDNSEPEDSLAAAPPTAPLQRQSSPTVPPPAALQRVSEQPPAQRASAGVLPAVRITPTKVIRATSHALVRSASETAVAADAAAAPAVHRMASVPLPTPLAAAASAAREVPTATAAASSEVGFATPTPKGAAASGEGAKGEAPRLQGVGIFVAENGAGFWGRVEGEEEVKCIFDEDGGRYVGTCIGTMKHGKGVCWYSNGDKYCGEWRNGLRHGQGRMDWTDGSSFEGLWRQDLVCPGIISKHGKRTAPRPSVHEEPSPHPMGSVWPALSDDMDKVYAQRQRLVTSPLAADLDGVSARGEALREVAAKQAAGVRRGEPRGRGGDVLAGIVTDVLGLADGVGSLVHHMVAGSPVELGTPEGVRKPQQERERYAVHGMRLTAEEWPEPTELLL